jgi:hypothetical protein
MSAMRKATSAVGGAKTIRNAAEDLLDGIPQRLDPHALGR